MVKILGMPQGVFWTIAIIAVAAVAWNMGLFDQFTAKQIASKTPVPQGIIGDTRLCGDDGLSNLELRTRNGVNASTTPDYTHGNSGGGALQLVDAITNKMLATYTSNSDGTYTSNANILDCGKPYYLVTVNNNSITGKSETFTPNSAITREDVVIAETSDLKFHIWDSGYANATNTSNTVSAGSQDFSSNVQTLGANELFSFRYQVQAITADTQFGTIERLCETETGICGRAFVCLTGDSAIYREGDLTIAGSAIVGKTLKLPKRCNTISPSNAGTGRAAYETIAIKNGWLADGTGTIQGGLGNPSGTQNVRYEWQDMHYFQAPDGTIEIGTADRSGSAIGETDRYFEIDVA